MTNYREILKKYWGYDDFRPMQEDIIKSVGEGKDTLGLLPTGGGKSITFQVPAMAKPGICLVVTPLIALMKDQVENLKKKGIKAYAVHSGLTGMEIQIAYDNCIYGGVKFLYLSPERLSTPVFLEKLQHLKVNLLAIDEAHCISQWGYDFRPGYLKIADVREHLPNVPVLALTATATPRVVDDIQEQLRFEKKNVFQKSFERTNLAYVVRKCEDKEGQLVKILSSVQGTAVVYVRNRKKTREYAEHLQKNGISADYFHAGLTQKVKDFRQQQWKSGACRVIVSTNAFGMGIDKPDVRIVVHMDAPDSLEAYFQEAGRAGRDEKKAYAVMLFSPADKMQLNKSVTTSFPEKEVIHKVYDSLCNFFQVAVGHGEGLVLDFNIGKFCTAFGFNILSVFNSLKILQRAGYLYYTEDSDIPSKVMMQMSDFELYKYQVANAKLDPFIKVLLRSYTGLFTEYASIDEDLLAQRLKVTRDDVYQALLTLSRAKVLHYIPQRRTPLITFLHRREELRHIVLAPEIYEQRQKEYRQRVDAVLEYATTTHICRSRLLLHYFGQGNSNNCGHCDVCLDRKKQNLTDDEFSKIEEAIYNTLNAEPISAESLTEKLSFAQDKTWKVIHWLEDVGAVSENQDGVMEWIGKR
ncbi:RecQ family ATP-dependent DNA helicase [Alkalitalea saponilacus]|uniref:ATP-dependent DNA helicase RecQ n=1 Tax=Alkalitalea saponilacus TaxID=889453 RepID=A0A1T5HL41_9BACT|nr:ATP-dependent DNA helicase RecQ [Alkalitalea saponilacus]ASB47806.1 recombinase RecQ [Alkalitalea saponilacus]SKC21395.1 ATP-dependent DNA helicase RecQ [Alkalitalea saponilacus]